MKMAKETLLEIVRLFHVGFTEEKNISDMLRDMELVVLKDNTVGLMEEYKLKSGYSPETD